MVACTSGPSHDPDPLDDTEAPEAPEQQRGYLGGSSDGRRDPIDEDTAPAEPVPDDHAALELVRDWVRAETTAYRGGNRDRLRNLASPDCKPCAQSLNAIAEAYADGGRPDGNYTQTISFIQGVTGTNPPVVQAILERSAHALLDADGGVREHIPESTRALEFRTAKEGSRWLITDIISAEG